MRSLRLGAVLYILITAAAAGGCAAGGGAGADSGADRYLITAEDLQPYVERNLNAYDAVSRLRRNWLMGVGGRSPRLFVDGEELGGGPS